MKCFYDLSDTARAMICIWVICIFILGLCNLFHSLQAKRKWHIAISTVLLIVGYFILQVIADIKDRHSGSESIMFTYKLGQISVLWWIIFIAAIMAISITLATFFKHWKEEHITSMSVKDSIDMLHAGLCYWEDGGKIILSNQKMAELCLAITGEALLNGEKFYEAVTSEWMALADGSIKCFVHNLVEFNEKQIHELVATDVTELYKKNEILKQETEILQKMNESLRRYNQNIEESVRKQEILDAKVYIHDEMNRLMLVTSAATETPISEEEFCSILTLWRNNAILLGNEVEKSRKNTDVSEIDRLANLLGIQLQWIGELPQNVPGTIREVFVKAVREAIANAVKHAEAKIVTVKIDTRDKNLAITISNDGKLPTGKISAGGGLTNVRRMVEARKGKLELMVNERFNMILDIPY